MSRLRRHPNNRFRCFGEIESFPVGREVPTGAARLEKTGEKMIAAAEYHSKDFDWEELRQEVESDPSLCYHFQETVPISFTSSYLSSSDSEAWSHFHSRHSTGRFFKERRYLLKEFPELIACADYSRLLEVGCGNGSSILPIMRSKENITVYACDCSNEALERAMETLERAHVSCLKERLHLFTCDFSVTGFPNWLAYDTFQQIFSDNPSCCSPGAEGNEGPLLSGLQSSDEDSCCVGGVDFVTLIFTLSAVPHERMPRAIKECFSVLKPGGCLFFRDYGLYDMTMLRFEPQKRVGFREYMRSDGTRSYFFSLESVRDLFIDAGFVELELEYCCVKSVNRQKRKSMQRVWVHGKFQKPL